MDVAGVRDQRSVPDPENFHAFEVPIASGEEQGRAAKDIHGASSRERGEKAHAVRAASLSGHRHG